MFICKHKDAFGVEPVCRVLTGSGWQIAPGTYYAAVLHWFNHRRPHSAIGDVTPVEPAGSSRTPAGPAAHRWPRW